MSLVCHLYISHVVQLIPREQEFKSRKNAGLWLSSPNEHWVEIAFWDWLGISGYIGSFKSQLPLKKIHIKIWIFCWKVLWEAEKIISLTGSAQGSLLSLHSNMAKFSWHFSE